MCALKRYPSANAFTGEGIGYALESAEIAARLVARTIREGAPDPADAYAEALRRRYGGLGRRDCGRRRWRGGARTRCRRRAPRRLRGCRRRRRRLGERARPRRAQREQAPGHDYHKRRGEGGAAHDRNGSCPPIRRAVRIRPEAIEDVLHERPQPRLLVERLCDDALHRGRNGASRAHRRRRLREVLLEDGVTRLRLERRHSTQHLVEDDGE